MATHDLNEFTAPQTAGGGDSFTGTGMSAAPLPAVSTDPYDGYVDYFGFDERDKWFFPDGRQWIEFKRMNEGDRAKFLKSTRSDVRLDQATKQAHIALDQSGDRKALLLASITNWHIVRRDPTSQRFVEIRFPAGDNRSPGSELAKWIDMQNPALLGSLEKAIRKVNPWLMNELTVEQIDKEIADLHELREAAVKREAENANF